MPTSPCSRAATPIEGALPYVNLGIVLAMAGMDTRRVREPDYTPERTRQTAEVTDMVKRVGDLVLSLWRERDRLRDQLRAAENGHRRTRQIFYDTDRILETQKEEIRVCDDCAGALRIDSASDRGVRILAVHIPRKACPRCRQTGRDWFEQADPGKFDHIFLQDRVEDKYRVTKGE